MGLGFSQTIPSKPEELSLCVYILKLEQDKYYVGKTTLPVIERYNQHLEGKGSVWTQKYKPVSILTFYVCKDGYEEDTYTKRYMAQYGIDNVRGGSYCTVDLSKETIALLEREIRSATDKCTGCGSSEHWVSDCPTLESKKKTTESNYCERCHRKGHTIDFCYAKTSRYGNTLPPVECKRCGNKGHSIGNCCVHLDYKSS